MAICDHCRNTLYVKEIDKKKCTNNNNNDAIQTSIFSPSNLSENWEKIGKTKWKFLISRKTGNNIGFSMQIHRKFDILTNECVCWCWFFIMVGNLFPRTAIVVVIWGGIMILICSKMTHFTEDCTKTNRNEHWTSPPDVAGVCSWSSFSFGEKEQKKVFPK